MLGPVGIIFVAVVVVFMAVAYAFSGGRMPISDRLGRLWRHPTAASSADLTEKRKAVFDSVLGTIARVIPSSSESPDEPPNALLVRAGFRRPEAETAMRAARVLAVLVLVVLVFSTGIYKQNPIFIFGIAVLGGYLAPDFWLTQRVKKRQQAIRLALPDALDLLVICVEAGLGLDQALLYISQELRVAHPELSQEFDIVNAEVNVGKSRLEALRSLSSRTGVEDVKALVATLIQTDRFGTSVAQTLRGHSDDLRLRRRQRAEEMAAKTAVKMVVPMVIFIFPALFVVILGPAVISLIRNLGSITHR